MTVETRELTPKELVEMMPVWHERDPRGLAEAVYQIQSHDPEGLCIEALTFYETYPPLLDENAPPPVTDQWNGGKALVFTSQTFSRGTVRRLLAFCDLFQLDFDAWIDDPEAGISFVVTPKEWAAPTEPV